MAREMLFWGRTQSRLRVKRRPLFFSICQYMKERPSSAYKCYYMYNHTDKKGVIVRIKNYLSSTNLAKNTAATLSSIAAGDTDKFIILKNNAPKAILMSIESYEAMEEEIEDLRLTALALSRIQSFDPGESISHKEMMKKYAK